MHFLEQARGAKGGSVPTHKQYKEAIRWRRVSSVLMAFFGGAVAAVLLIGQPSQGLLVLLAGCGLASLLAALFYGAAAKEIRARHNM
jgi:4-hydroxybenzoate polyprenyltransferase